MGIHDRDYNTGRSGGGGGRGAGRRGRGGADFGEGGGFVRAFKRIFSEGDNFFSWAIPLYTAFGIRVRIHILLIIFAAIKLMNPIVPGSVGFMYAAYFLLSGFIFVLLHEYGHSLSCRYVGGESDDIILWPLGGLAMCRPPHDWKNSFITTICGPLVNVALAIIFAGVLLSLGAGWGTIFFHPLQPSGVIASQRWFNEDAAHWKVMLFFAYQSNVMLAAFNLLVPMFPMDCGRIVQELLWAKVGYRRSMAIATTLGLVVAVCLGAFAALTGQNALFSIAVFGGMTCYMQKMHLKVMGDDEPWAESLRADTAQDQRKYAQALKQQQREQAKQVEVDRILAKIASTGMDSLSRAEKATLKEATERKRAGA